MENSDIRARVLAAVEKAERAVKTKGDSAADGFDPNKRADAPSYPEPPPAPRTDSLADWREYAGILEDHIGDMAKSIESRAKMLRLATDPKAIADAIISVNKNS